MAPKYGPRQFFKHYGNQLGILTIPLLINLSVLVVLVMPQQASLAQWRQAQSLKQLKPNLEALLAKSDRAIQNWQRTGFTAADPAAVTQTVKRLADQCHIQVQELSTSSQHGRNDESAKTKIVHGFTTMPLELEATGSFNKLARWMGEIEAVSGLQIENWTLGGGESGKPHRLTIKLTAWLKSA